MRIVFAGGGTSGHINPAIAAAKYIKRRMPDAEILFIGTENHIEAKLVPEAGFKIEFIDIRGFRRSLSPYNLGTLRRIFTSRRRCKKIYKEFKPDIVVGMGGYVSGPTLLAAHKLGIPCLIHEQNAVAGMTTKLAAKYASAVMLTFPEAAAQLPQGTRSVVTGVPIYEDLLKLDKAECRRELGFDDRPLLLCSGGSLGARTINDAMLAYIIRHHKEEKIQIVHGIGKFYYEEFMKALDDAGVETGGSIRVFEYIKDMPKYMTACDAVVCRCGASSLAEMSAAGKPAIIIPSPNVTDNHQFHNAKHLADAGAAILVDDKDYNCKALEDGLETIIFDNAKRNEMTENLKKAAVYDYGERVFDCIISELERAGK